MTINSPVNIHKGDNIAVVHKRFPLALNNSKFSSFAPRHRLSKLISALSLASVVIAFSDLKVLTKLVQTSEKQACLHSYSECSQDSTKLKRSVGRISRRADAV